MAASPTQLSLKRMREAGYHAEVVEHWNAFIKRRKDLFGFIDVLCLGDDEVIGVQSTSYANVSARVTKIAEHDNVGRVRKAGIRIVVHGWRKVAGRWTCREVDCS